MEQTVNSFTKGMQKDTHPMMQGTESLTDALNATLVTMNGNEVILQNDMGNRKVDGAKLHPGYEPVGIKEYGGVIYVASYNPITNRSQIGSFPSPQRIFNSRLNEGEGQISNLEEYFINEDDYYIYSDSKILPLTNYPLRAGDKFIICIDNNFNFSNVSNYNVINTSLALDPYVNLNNNKLFTLFAGVLNSQNEFVDITKSLVRWDELGNVINTDGLSEKAKFNTGYFIRKSPYSNGEVSNLSINDAQYETYDEGKMRILEANTYSYKLVSPLYLKIQLNHIQNFSYNLYGVKDENGDYSIYIEANIKYNCPAYTTLLNQQNENNLLSANNTNDSEEETQEETSVQQRGLRTYRNNYISGDLSQYGKIEKLQDVDLVESGVYPLNSDLYSLTRIDSFTGCFDFFIIDGDNEYLLVQDTDDTSYPKFEGHLDSKTNLYNATVTKKYKILSTANQGEIEVHTEESSQQTITLNNSILNYTIKVFGFRYEGNTYYMKNLSVENKEIDLSKINSGILELKEWRFTNNYDEKKGIISYWLNAYPEYGYEFQNMCLKLLDVTFSPGDNLSDKYKTIPNIPCNNGNNEIELNWEELGLNPNAWYKAKLEYRKVSKTNKEYNNINIDIQHQNENEFDSSIPTPSPINPLSTFSGFKDVEQYDEFYLTTELFNSNYILGSQDYVDDYGKHLVSVSQNNLILNKLNVTPEYIINNNITITKDSAPSIGGQLYYTQNFNQSVRYSEEYGKTVSSSINDITVYFDEKLYPSWVLNTHLDITVINKITEEKDEQEWNDLNSTNNNAQSFQDGVRVSYDPNIGTSKTIQLSNVNPKTVYKLEDNLIRKAYTYINKIESATLTSVSIENTLKRINDLSNTELDSILFGSNYHYGIFPDANNDGYYEIIGAKQYGDSDHTTPMNFSSTYSHVILRDKAHPTFEEIEATVYRYMNDWTNSSCCFLLSNRESGDYEWFSNNPDYNFKECVDNQYYAPNSRNYNTRVFWKLSGGNTYGLLEKIFTSEVTLNGSTLSYQDRDNNIKSEIREWFKGIFGDAVIHRSNSQTSIYIPSNYTITGYSTFTIKVSNIVSNTSTAVTKGGITFTVLGSTKSIVESVVIEENIESIRSTLENLESEIQGIQCAYIGNNIVLSKDKEGNNLNTNSVYKLSNNSLENKSDGILKYQDQKLVFEVTQKTVGFNSNFTNTQYDKYTSRGYTYTCSVLYNNVYLINENINW